MESKKTGVRVDGKRNDIGRKTLKKHLHKTYLYLQKSRLHLNLQIYTKHFLKTVRKMLEMFRILIMN